MIEVELLADVAVLRLNAPEKLNALAADEKQELADAVRSIGTRDEIVGMVLTGGGTKAFCVGSDIREMAELYYEAMVEMVFAEKSLYEAILTSRKPVGAAVNGFAMGTGFILALVSDYVVATKGAVFAMPEIKIGATTPIHGLMLASVVGLGWSRSLFYSGRRLDSGEALRLGIVHEEVETAEACLSRAVEQIGATGRMASGFALQKQWLTRFALTGAMDSVIEESIYSSAHQLGGAEVRDAISQLLSRRKQRDSRDG